MNEIGILVADEVQYAADWRREVADSHPNDADRNLKAAEILDRIALDLQNLERSEWHWRIQALCSKDASRYSEILSTLVRSVGFSSSAKTGAKFCEELCFLAEAWELDSEPVIVPLSKEV
jgi:hypothetical protein